MQRKIPTEAGDNHPFFAQVYKDLLAVDHSFQGKAWSVNEFLYNMYSLLNNYLLTEPELPNKLDFYDSHLYEKFKNRREGHQYTLEFLVSWIKFYQDSLEVRLIHQLSTSTDFVDAIKFLLKARKVAIAINNLDPAGSWSSDKIFLDRKAVVNFCDELFGSGSDSEKVWKWLQQEYRHFQDLKYSSTDTDGVKLLVGHIKSDEVSLSYLLEFVLKDFLPARKRYINKLYGVDKTSAGPVTEDASPSKQIHANNSIDVPLNNDHSVYDSPADNYMLYGTNDPNSNKKNGVKFENDARYFSTPNLHQNGNNDDVLGMRFRRKKMVQEISKLSKNMNNKRVALVKALSLCRIIDPINVQTKKKAYDMKSIIANVSNVVLDNKSKNRI